MQRTQTLALNFSDPAQSEIYCDAFCGDMHSNVIGLTVSPTPQEGEILICSFMKNGTPVETVVVRNNSLTIPYSVLREPGAYTAAFALCDMQNRLTASVLLTVRVAEDRIALGPTEDADDQSLVCYVLTQAAASARAAAQEELATLNTRVGTLETAASNLNGRVSTLESGAQTALSRLGGLDNRVDGIEDDVDDLEDDVGALDTRVSAAISEIQTEAGQIESNLNAMQTSVSGLSAAVTQIISTRLISSSGTATLSSSEGPYYCQQAQASWVRIGPMVVLTFGFYSYGSQHFTVSGLPFAAGTLPSSATIRHIDFSDGEHTFTADSVLDACQTVAGTSTFTVRRAGTSAAILSGTLVYFVSDT